MNKKEFEKLNYCLELLAVAELISNEKKLSKKKLLDYKVFDCYYQEEFDKFVEEHWGTYSDNVQTVTASATTVTETKKRGRKPKNQILDV